MPQIFIDGQPFQARTDQTVLQVADEHGIFIPRLCWHPQLSIAGNCRICVVQVEGRSWVEISCNMPVSEGLRVLTDSALVREHRKATMQFITLNHPVDCGVCDKAGECTLQDYHVAFNGEASISLEPKVVASKFYSLGQRITLDNERCILCTRCVRFTREVSKSHALGVQNRGDHSLIRPALGVRPQDQADAWSAPQGERNTWDGPACSGERVLALDDDPYSENIVDICPVGALLSKGFLYKDRVWYLQATPSVCPGCERGCSIDIWHRKPEWALRRLSGQADGPIARVTPRDNPTVNGPWICNKARDLGALLGRPRAEAPMRKGRVVTLDEATAAARALVAAARRPVALVSSWGSDEELEAFHDSLGPRFACFVKADHAPAEGEVLQDDLLIRADKNPNGHTARTLFGDAPPEFPAECDLVLVWGEGTDFARLPRGVPVIALNAFLAPENGHAAVFFALSLHTERAGHFTNFAGVRSAFSRCFAKPAGAVDAEALFRALATQPQPEVATP